MGGKKLKENLEEERDKNSILEASDGIYGNKNIIGVEKKYNTRKNGDRN